MEWKPAVIKDDGTITIPDRWLLLHYYEALNILFRMENALRVFVYVVLKNKFNEKWADTALQSADDEQSTIAAVAAKRVAQAKGFGYLGYEISSPLMYLNSGELTRIITSDSYWEIFKPFFRGRREIIRTKLEEIGTVRNALAHFRPLKYDDVELIKQNVKHAFIGIEQCLMEMTQTSRPVPTNTEGEWYKNLITLGTELCTVRLFQDKSETWLRIEIDYACALLKSSGPSRWRTFTITNLISPAIIKHYPKLASQCTFVTEYIPYVPMSEQGNPQFRKQVSLVFTKAAILNQHLDIGRALKEMILKVESETELVQKDNLARGNLIDSARTSSFLEKDSKWWRTNTDNMKIEFGENDPAEYWGELGRETDDFIAGAPKYPWMPSDISKEESPF
jgi:hypothetical protein